MKENSSRRLFLRNTALATTGIAFISSTQTVSALTNVQVPYSGYNPYIEEKTDLRSFLATEKIVEVKGKIYDTSGENILTNATVEVWHLSPNSTKYRHRGKTITNSNGEYNFITEMPNREEGKMPRIFFKVSSAGQEYFTELLLGITGAHITAKHWEENKLPQRKLFPKTTIQSGKTSIYFNLTN